MAEIFSQIAINMMNFILIIVAFELTGSNMAVSGIVLSFTIPAILFGIYAGSYVDKRAKKTILIWTNLIRAFLLFILALSHSNIFFIYALAVLITIVTQFFIPAETPIIPLLVNKKLLLSANALFGIGVYGSVLVAYALSGPVYFFFKNYVFFLLAALFFIAAVFSFLIRVPFVKKQNILNNVEVSFRDEIKGLFYLLARTKALYHSLFLLTMSQVIILILATIGPGYGRQILGISVDEFPLFFVTPAALGMFIGAMVIGIFFHNRRREMMATIGVVLSGIGIFLLPYGSKVASKGFITTINTFLPAFLTVDILHMMIFFAFFLGVANALVFVPSNTLLQEKTEDTYRGKVYGLLNALVGLSSLLPIIIVGSFADLIGVGWVLTGIGSTVMFLGVVRMFLWRKR
ncbi:MAG: MFS transporter [Candidatus Levybacteria bacterium]|nr:MFS transporter [Candidatus Levybacteria bacterium]